MINKLRAYAFSNNILPGSDHSGAPGRRRRSSGAPYPFREESETHKLIFSWLPWPLFFFFFFFFLIIIIIISVQYVYSHYLQLNNSCLLCLHYNSILTRTLLLNTTTYILLLQLSTTATTLTVLKYTILYNINTDTTASSKLQLA